MSITSTTIQLVDIYVYMANIIWHSIVYKITEPDRHTAQMNLPGCNADWFIVDWMFKDWLPKRPLSILPFTMIRLLPFQFLSRSYFLISWSLSPSVDSPHVFRRRVHSASLWWRQLHRQWLRETTHPDYGHCGQVSGWEITVNSFEF